MSFRNIASRQKISLKHNAIQFCIHHLPANAEEVEVHEFLKDHFNDARVTPIQLGHFPHQCVGNVAHCDVGFTLSLWTRPAPGDPSLPHLYIVSSGGQSHMSQGYYIR